MGTCVLLKILLVEAEESEEDVKLPIESIAARGSSPHLLSPSRPYRVGQLSKKRHGVVLSAAKFRRSDRGILQFYLRTYGCEMDTGLMIRRDFLYVVTET